MHHITFNGTAPDTSDACRHAQQHNLNALAAFANGPGDVDITWGKIGDRWGFVVSMAHPANLTIDIRSALIKCRATALYFSEINSDQYLVDGSGGELVEEFGISRQKMRGRVITAP
jgi:hypothetical protein